ncbi:MAG: 50S ribosomal protein L9 [Pseudomonadota bacterium]
MQIILLEKVTNLGGLGDVVKVRNGFARNFLIPQGKAKRATRDNLALFEQRRSELEKVQAEQLTQAQDKAARIDGLNVQIAQKAGVDGKLFGSVTNADIAEALKQQGFEVAKSAVRMPEGPLKNVGEYPLKVALHTDVIVTVNVAVVPEP